MHKDITTVMVKWSKRIYTMIFLLSISALTFADSVIPISSDDQVSDSKDALSILFSIFLRVIPIFEIAGAIYLLYTALTGLWKGYKEYQEKKDLGPLKEAIIAAVMIILVGGVILFLLDALKTKIKPV